MNNLEDLNVLFDNLNLSAVTKNRVTMPNDTDYQLLRLCLDSVPHYDGNPHTLNVFIDNCDFLYTTFYSANNVALGQFLLRAIIGKLTGRALMLIGSRIELVTWDQVKQALRLSFGDQRNLECLVQDLLSLRPFKNESPYNFGMRCQDARSLIVSKLNCLVMSQAEKQIRLENYNELSLTTFLRGLPINIQTNVRLRNPDSLEKAMGLVIEEENFLYASQRTNNINSQNFKPSQRVVPTQNTQNQPMTRLMPVPIQQPNFNFIRPNLTYQHQQQPSRPNFQNSQFNANQQLMNRPTQNFGNFRPNFNPTNFNRQTPQQSSQNFRLNQNSNFIPRHNQGQQKVEPMDTSSGNTRINQANRPKPNWTATELFNQNVQFENPFEQQNFDQTDYDYSCIDPYYNASYATSMTPYVEPSYSANSGAIQETEYPFNPETSDTANTDTNETNFREISSATQPT